MKINAVYTLCCDSFLVSEHVHDFVTCSCGKVSIDGGNDYHKRVGNPENYVNLSSAKQMAILASQSQKCHKELLLQPNQYSFSPAKKKFDEMISSLR